MTRSIEFFGPTRRQVIEVNTAARNCMLALEMAAKCAEGSDKKEQYLRFAENYSREAFALSRRARYYVYL